MPFDQFSIEQLAGDLLPNATLDQKIATGFLRAVATNLSGGTKFDEVRAAVLSDRVTTTGTVWLGETLLCAQCHTHKFDPITITEYYQFDAFFNNDVREIIPHPSGRKTYAGATAGLPVSVARKAETENLTQQVQKNAAKLESEKQKVLSLLESWFEKQRQAKKQPSGLVRLVGTSFNQLNEKMGGPPILPEQPDGLWSMIVGVQDPEYRTSSGVERYRRGIYVVRRRGAMYPSFSAFDASDRATCKTQQVRTNTPLQALVLLNDPVYLEAAAALAQRMRQGASGSSAKERATYGFRLCVAREPNPFELAALLDLFRSKRQEFQRNPGLVKQQDMVSHAADPEQLAWFYVAHTLLNLDETITKR